MYASVPAALHDCKPDVLVDFTSATSVRRNGWAAANAGVDVVIGSSGLTADDYVELDGLARDRGVG